MQASPAMGSSARARPDWDADLDKPDSTFTGYKQVIEGMVEAGFGRVINTSSVNEPEGQFGQVK
jgi:acetoacetyl-CoA reductase